jgi:uncharacterized protein (TIGR03086 family)
MYTDDDMVHAHARALEAATALVETIVATDLDRPTPCVRWNLRDLIGHMIGQHLGFEKAVATGNAQLADFRPVSVTPDSVHDLWRDSVDRLGAVLAVMDPRATVRLVEIDATVRFDRRSVLGIQLLDTAVHAWDIATTLGRPFRPDADIVELVADVADRIPDGAARDVTKAFDQPKTLGTTDDLWSSTLARLGRTMSLPALAGGRRTVSSGAVWEPVVGYSRAVRIGPWVAVAGTTAAGPDGPVGGNDPAAQTREAIRRIASALDELDVSLQDVIRTRMFVTDISRWEEIGRAHGEAFGDIRPAASMVEVKALIDPALLVEIEADAVVAAR